MGCQVYLKTRLFFVQYFSAKVKKLRVALYNESGKTRLLSGDVESDPGHITNATWCISSVATGRSVSDFLSNYRAFSHDIMAAIFVFQNNPVGVELFS